MERLTTITKSSSSDPTRPRRPEEPTGEGHTSEEGCLLDPEVQGSDGPDSISEIRYEPPSTFFPRGPDRRCESTLNRRRYTSTLPTLHDSWTGRTRLWDWELPLDPLSLGKKNRCGRGSRSAPLSPRPPPSRPHSTESTVVRTVIRVRNRPKEHIWKQTTHGTRGTGLRKSRTKTY